MIILVFTFGVGGESRSTGSGYSSASKSQKVTTNDSEKQGGSPKVIAKNYSDKDRFYRDKGGSGILTPQGENGICIYVDRDGALTNDHEFVCTAGEYDSGKVIIKTRTGKNVNV